jgi:hypothetical protein
MATKRQRKKLLPQAVGFLLLITGFDLGDKKKQEDLKRFLSEANSFFLAQRQKRSSKRANPSKKRKFAYFEIRKGMEIAFSQSSLGVLVIRFDADFSEAGKMWRPWSESWRRDVPKYIQSSFTFTLATMSQYLYESSEV